MLQYNAFSSMQIYSVYAMLTLLSLLTIYREIIGQTLTGIQDACSDVTILRNSILQPTTFHPPLGPILVLRV